MTSTQPNQTGIMYIKLGPYLETLQTIERTKASQEQRKVPTMKELAEAADINPVSLSRLVTGKIASLNFKIGALILDELNRRGFPATPNDILAYHPPEMR
ncbi:MAG: helix-turn-helix domain-containing protein [Ardenticatenaceae bacterium]